MTKELATQGGKIEDTHPIAVATAKSLGFFVFLRGALLFLDAGSIGRFGDPDAYMRMNRVVHLWRSGRWFDQVYPRIGAEGLTQHWTRPMDVLLLIGGAVGSPFVGFDTALHWWGLVVTPLMMVAVLAILMWAAKPLCLPQWLWLVGLVYIAQPGSLLTFDFGRPDHNTIIVPLFVAYLGAMIRLIMEPTRSRTPIIAGIVAGLALWVSLEVVIVLAIATLALIAAWVSGIQHIPTAMAQKSLALLLTVTVWLPVEFGVIDAYQTEFRDQISAFHLVALSINVLVWATLAVARSQDRWPLTTTLKRAGATILVVIPSLGLLFLATPGVVHHPLGLVDPLYAETRLVKIAELQPLFAFDAFDLNGLIVGTRSVLIWLGVGITGLIAMIHRALLGRRHDAKLARQQWAWVFVGTVGAVYFTITLIQIRWVPFAVTAFSLPAGALAAALAQWVTKRVPTPWLTVARPFALLLICTWPYVAAVALSIGQDHYTTDDTQTEVATPDTNGSCPVTELAEALTAPERLGDHPQMVMIFVDFGPELLYNSPYSVMSIPNHRFQPGYSATYNAMSGPAAEGEDLLRSNRVDAVVICTGSESERSLYGTTIGSQSLYELLARDEPLDRLAPVPLPDDLDRYFGVWKVVS